jgi:hypothetical protein
MWPMLQGERELVHTNSNLAKNLFASSFARSSQDLATCVASTNKSLAQSNKSLDDDDATLRSVRPHQ